MTPNCEILLPPRLVPRFPRSSIGNGPWEPENEPTKQHSHTRRVRKTRSPLVQDKLFCLWDKCEFLFTYVLNVYLSKEQFLWTSDTFSSFQFAQRTNRVKSWKREKEDSLAHWTSASQSFLLALTRTPSPLTFETITSSTQSLTPKFSGARGLNMSCASRLLLTNINPHH